MIVVAYLFPLALYLFVLGVVNRRTRPLMVPATWDFVGLLFGVSGFLIFSFPAMLSGFSERWRMLWLVGQAEGLAGSPDNGYGVWILLSVGYFLGVVAIAAVALAGRSRQTSIYNVEAAAFEDVLAGALDTSGLLWSRSGDRYFLRLPTRAVSREAVQSEGGSLRITARHGLKEAEQPGGREPTASLHVDAAPALRHVMLRWKADGDEVRSVVEAELGRALATVRTPDNPVAGWLLLVSTVLLLMTMLAMAAVAVFRVLGR